MVHAAEVDSTNSTAALAPPASDNVLTGDILSPYYLPVLVFTLSVFFSAAVRARSRRVRNACDHWSLRRACRRRAGCNWCARVKELQHPWLRVFSLDALTRLVDMSAGRVGLLVSLWLATLLHVALKTEAVTDAGVKTMPAARGFGTASTLLLAMTTMPATRTSLWVRLFGVPFERAVQIHRISARMFLVCGWCHGILATVEYGVGDVLTLAASERHPPLLGVVALLLFTTMAGLALEPIRRRAFELFYYSHFLFILAVGITALHNKTVGLYGFPAFVLYVIDRFQRWQAGRAIVEVVGAESKPSFVKLELRLRGFEWTAGQFVMVNVPAVSALQWHPVSISRHQPVAGADKWTFTVHFRKQGPQSWTRRVAAAVDQHLTSARSGASETPGEAPDTHDAVQLPLRVRIDGPLGNIGIELHQCSALVLVAGGIGITPLVAVLGRVADAVQRGNMPRMQVVQLVWAVRDVDLLEEFSNQLDEALRCKLVKVNVFLTRPTAGLGDEDELPTMLFYTRSRPDVAAILKEHGAAVAPTSTKAVLVCGPPPLVHATRAAAHEAGFQLHAESFEL